MFDVEFSQFQGTGTTLKCTENASTSFMQIIHSLDKSMFGKTSRLFYALLCFAVPPLLLGLKVLNHRAKNAHHNKFCLLWLFFASLSLIKALASCHSIAYYSYYVH